jgi:hypothetical protein
MCVTMPSFRRGLAGRTRAFFDAMTAPLVVRGLGDRHSTRLLLQALGVSRHCGHHPTKPRGQTGSKVPVSVVVGQGWNSARTLSRTPDGVVAPAPRSDHVIVHGTIGPGSTTTRLPCLDNGGQKAHNRSAGYAPIQRNSDDDSNGDRGFGRMRPFCASARESFRPRARRGS